MNTTNSAATIQGLRLASQISNASIQGEFNLTMGMIYAIELPSVVMALLLRKCHKKQKVMQSCSFMS